MYLSKGKTMDSLEDKLKYKIDDYGIKVPRVITKVYLLGRLGKAVLWQNDADFTDEYFIIDKNGKPERIRAGNAALLFDIASEYQKLEKDYLDNNLLKKLEYNTINFRALTVTIDGFDSDLTDETRLFSIGLANKLLENTNSTEYSFVRNRLLSHNLPKGADIDGAIKFAMEKRANHVQGLYNDISLKNNGILMSSVPECRKYAEDFQVLLEGTNNKIIFIENDLEPEESEEELVQDSILCKSIVLFGINFKEYIEQRLSLISKQLTEPKLVYIYNPNNLPINSLLSMYNKVNIDLKFFSDKNNVPEGLVA